MYVHVCVRIIHTSNSCYARTSVYYVLAGFGVLVLNNCAGGNLYNAEIVNYLHGPVCLDKDKPYYLGAEHGSNNSAELTAIGIYVCILSLLCSYDINIC